MLEPMSDPLERYAVAVTVLTGRCFEFAGKAMTRIDRMYDQTRRERIADTLHAADAGGRPFTFAGQQILIQPIIG